MGKNGYISWQDLISQSKKCETQEFREHIVILESFSETFVINVILDSGGRFLGIKNLSKKTAHGPEVLFSAF